MGVTVGVNHMSVVHKASSGIAIAFPDVCKTPTPGIPLPIPYPAIAKTATESRKTATKVTKNVTMSKSTRYNRSSGDEAGSQKGLISSRNMARAEYKQLQGVLVQLNTKIQNMDSDDPNAWQKLVQDYVVAAGALYATRQSKK